MEEQITNQEDTNDTTPLFIIFASLLPLVSVFYWKMINTLEPLLCTYAF